MLWQRIRIALLTGALVAMTGLTTWAAEEDKDAPKEGEKIVNPPKEKAPAPAPPVSACAPGCAPTTCTVWVNEWVNETVPCTRTVYKKECRTEEYTAYKQECVQETRNVTTYRKVCETVNEMRTVCVTVPCVEERTVYKTVTVCKPVTHVTKKCEDHGHYECKEVPCGSSFGHSLFHKKDSCDTCASSCGSCGTTCCEPVKTKTVKVWVACPVTVEKCCTKMEKVKECHAEVCKVTVCKKVQKTECVPVTHVKCIAECHPCTVNVMKCVPYKATRTVEVCVPCKETVMVTHCVCKKVAKEVPVAPCASTSCSCATDCCESHSHKLSSFFHKN